MIINDLDGYYIVFDTKNWNTELDTLSAYPTVPITLSKVKAYLDTVDDWRELDDSHLALLYNFNLKK